ncbi:hypothetical protein [Pseudomonas sp. RIT-PI-o]|uniref:hypothetical protein n=1 Tax=Pseudomonas sp. RIT-PI-o TaxID=1690246 RepID=UPI0006CCFD91|nr:hypothetical protein [Pseudomonas sp. RIT-PI-o]KPG82274.1 hypothetical protein AEQ63_13825 [Pseudomonas sp. RIT-PI-o]
MIDAQKQKSGFFAENIRWVRPLIIALILQVVPGIADQLGGIKMPSAVFLLLGLLAMVYAGIMARLTDTLAAKIFTYIVIAAAVIVLGVKLAQYI